ncbi:hypothetical protein KR044_010078, partial [Drosophila immigrans]
YLGDLQDRLKQTVKQHSQIIHSSVSLIKELGEVSTMLSLSQSGSDLQATKIKRLIMEFENMHAGDTGEGLSTNDVRNLNAIIADYRRLEESHLLQDSLMCCKFANESLEKVQSLMNQLKTNDWEIPEASPQSSQSVNRSLREKIRAFNQASEQGKNPLQNFSQCFSSNSSTDIVTRDPLNTTRFRTNPGYEGDVDSEMDQ